MEYNNGFKVILFGNSKYDNDAFHPIENIEVNLLQLEKSLSDKSIIGIPKDNIKIYSNLTELDTKEKLDNISSEIEPDDTVLVYFSGHGVFSDKNFKLYLACKNTKSEKVHVNGLSISKFKKFINRIKCERKFIILDCCYSGKIHKGAMNSSFENHLVNQINQYKGTFTLTSTSQTEISLYPHDKPEEPTYFTGQIIKSLNEGIDNNKQYITMLDIFLKIKTDFKQMGMPIPQSSSFNNLYQYPFAYNKLWKSSMNNSGLKIINQSIIPSNHVFIFHSKKTGASTFIGALIKTVQNSSSARLRLFSRTRTVLHYYNNAIAKFIENNEFPSESIPGKAVEFNIGISCNKTSETVSFSILDISGIDSHNVLDYKTDKTPLYDYLINSKYIVILTSIDKANLDDLEISAFFEKLQKLGINKPIEIIISKWDEIEENLSLNNFVQKNMPNTFSWLSTKEYKNVNVFNFSIYSNSGITFELFNNTYSKQFINRLWKSFTNTSNNLFNTGLIKKEDSDLRTIKNELYNLIEKSRINDVFKIMLKSNLSVQKESEIRLLCSNWKELEQKEREDLISGKKLINKKTQIKSKLLNYIYQV